MAADLIGLLGNIRTVMSQFQSQCDNALALHEAKCWLYLFSQDKHTTCQQYHETFKNNVKVIEYCGGMLGNDPALVNAELRWWSPICSYSTNFTCFYIRGYSVEVYQMVTLLPLVAFFNLLDSSST